MWEIKLTTGNQDPRHLLIKVVKILSRLNIPYLVTGGIAVLVWGRPRFTADIDLVVEIKEQDLSKLQIALKELSHKGYIDLDAMKDAFEHQGEFNFIDGDTGVKVDFWIMTNSVLDQSRFERKRPKKILGADVYFSSPEDLILIKLKWHKESESSRQFEDVQSILKITENLDRDYIEKMANQLGLIDVWHQVSSK